jgi:acyl carrier protein
VIEERIREFIASDLNWAGPPEALTDDFPLLEKHVLDSVGIMHLVSFVEDEFGVEVQDTDLVPQHFGTIGGIARLVGSKRG